MDSDHEPPFDGQTGEIVEEKDESHFQGIEDIALQIKYGDGDELRSALEGLQAMVSESTIDGEWLADEGLISILFSRLSSNQSVERPAILRVLRTIASQSAEVKVLICWDYRTCDRIISYHMRYNRLFML